MERALIENETLRLYCGDAEMYAVPLADLPWYSDVRPWVYSPAKWQLAQKVASCFTYENGEVRVTLHLEPAALGCTAWKLSATYTNISTQPLKRFTAGMTLPLTAQDKHKITIPHIIYNDNPSADPERTVPHIGKVPGEGIIVEEHRLPIPAVNAEWRQGSGHAFLTLLSVSEVMEGDEEEYWSLGVVKAQQGERIMALSGPLMFNGMKDVVYGGRCTPMSYLKGYRKLLPGESLTKAFYLSWGQTGEGRGFRNLIDLGYDVLQPQTAAQHSYAQMIDYKKLVVDTRAYQDDHCIGYQTFGSANAFGDISGRPDFFLYGWTGQAIKIAWSECMLGLLDEGQRFRLERGIRCADFFVRRSEGAVPGLFRGYYMVEADSFRGMWDDADAPNSSRIQGESLSDLIDLMTLLRQHGQSIPEGWEAAIRRAASFLMDASRQTQDGLYPLEWGADGSVLTHDINAAGMPCVLALTKAAEYFGDAALLTYAEEKYQRYAHYHMDTFDIPFARATRDARCEDKEAGIYFFETAAGLYRITHKPCYREWAEITADWLLTFVYFWETGFEKGTACDGNGFRTTGWPGVSVQNHHLDVFFPTYELYAFAKDTGNARLMEMALHVSRALTYGVCTREGEWGYTVVGEQGEQYYQTNYFQLPYPVLLKYLGNFRGGMQVWNPSWITAQVLSSALKFHYWEEMA